MRRKGGWAASDVVIVIWNTRGRSDLVEIMSLIFNTFKTIDLCHL